jgi:hypothetical protein
VKGNKLTSLAAPAKNGTCCATIINVGPTVGAGQPGYFNDFGQLTPFSNKTVPMGNITMCAIDAANPGKRKNAEVTGEELKTFTLSMPRTCDGNLSLNVKNADKEAHPRTCTHRHTVFTCLRTFSTVFSIHFALNYPSSTANHVEYPEYGTCYEYQSTLECNYTIRWHL